MGGAGGAETYLFSSQAFRLRETIFKELPSREPHPPVDLIYLTKSDLKTKAIMERDFGGLGRE